MDFGLGAKQDHKRAAISCCLFAATTGLQQICTSKNGNRWHFCFTNFCLQNAPFFEDCLLLGVVQLLANLLLVISHKKI